MMAVEHGTKMVPSPSPRKVKEYQVAVCGARSGSGGAVKHAMLLATYHRIDPLPLPPIQLCVLLVLAAEHGTNTAPSPSRPASEQMSVRVRRGQCACAGSQGGGGKGESTL